MIKSNDLRLGNWVSNGNPVRVTFYMLDNDSFFGNDYEYDIDYDPIPLTPEVLDKCGCVRSKDPETWHHPSGISLTRISNGKFFTNGFKDGHYIEYLHQYQNTIYWATGQELKVEFN